MAPEPQLLSSGPYRLKVMVPVSAKPPLSVAVSTTEPPTEAVSLRAGDVAALATASGRTAEELEEALAKAARR